MRFIDRSDAGKRLGQLLAAKYRGKDGVIYAIPRGGVILGAEIARALNMPLDVVITRKIGHPENPEFAIAAITEDGNLVADRQRIGQVDDAWFRHQLQIEQREAQRRRRVYMAGQAPRHATGKIAIIVDDGLATGLTMEAAVRELQRQKPARLIIAVPVAPADAAVYFESEVDEFVALDVPDYFLGAVGAYYDNFPQVSDDDVTALLSVRPSPIVHH